VNVEIDKYTKNKLCAKLVLFTKCPNMFLNSNTFILNVYKQTVLWNCWYRKGLWQSFILYNNITLNIFHSLSCVLFIKIILEFCFCFKIKLIIQT